MRKCGQVHNWINERSPAILSSCDLPLVTLHPTWYTIHTRRVASHRDVPRLTVYSRDRLLIISRGVSGCSDTALPDSSTSRKRNRSLVKSHTTSWFPRRKGKNCLDTFFHRARIIGITSPRTNKIALIRRFVMNALYTAYNFARVSISQFLTFLLNITIKVPIHRWTNRRCELTVKDESRSISPGDAFANYFWWFDLSPRPIKLLRVTQTAGVSPDA